MIKVFRKKAETLREKLAFVTFKKCLCFFTQTGQEKQKLTSLEKKLTSLEKKHFLYIAKQPQFIGAFFLPFFILKLEVRLKKPELLPLVFQRAHFPNEETLI